MTLSTLPPFTDSAMSVFMYLSTAYILVCAITALYFRIKLSAAPGWAVRPVVWLGAANAALGLFGFFLNYTQAMQAIQAAGDISPSILAGAYVLSGSYPVLGFLSLSIAFLFQFFSVQVKG